MNMPFRLVSVATTHPGLVRRVNEDRHCERAEDGLWVVADGMGGHAHGDWAAHAVVQALEGVALPADFDAAVQTVADGVHSANRRIWAEAQRREQQMGSTVVALLIRGDRFAALWVGDSRAYLLRDDMLVPLTRDHSQVQEMVDRGLIAPEEAAHHPRGHVLARAIGVGARIAVDVVADNVEPGDRFLLCSDGLSGPVADEELRQSLVRHAPSEAVEALLAQALARGAPDNVTAIIVAAQEATRLTFADAGGGRS
ncbi:phosphatase 2C family protein [Sphingomonas sp. S17]|jgi:serine/threonine protein phosphatase PrpC|uniref:Serine/threonine-protein phosphatase n=2 Tax=Sphingomonas paucimobilis TaxID=13689 RepID=A0A7T3A760_SPHPI|nr:MULTISPECIES: protein phosphatase 2C domain-containing protein [Sphingomonas]EGI55378.1 phosphatase 2C family protein [Sphingomonas sp. S17]MCM3680649.1 protein phosphatase 2C domain-containing protein [Sphingomonas paucimobilis]MDG5971330.1 protein phosphatase 2C domain-containing protein [Sphingomonas paucimobilis]QPS15904.1 serine/threonine-protein phosphatase [Sphingomonas paucimobilis]QPT07358.1 serine/threonine-protein phosphatase [Sphingomonas paucimobilis]